MAAPETRATRWMLWVGAAALASAAVCLAATVLGMIWSFDAAAASSSPPKPADRFLSRNTGTGREAAAGRFPCFPKLVEEANSVLDAAHSMLMLVAPRLRHIHRRASFLPAVRHLSKFSRNLRTSP
jgi:hypothetical protein